MTQAFIGQITPFAFGYAPKNWAGCDGQLLQISQNQALFAVLGTYYGGDGVRNFALPDLRSRTPIHYGTAISRTSYTLGQNGGEPAVALVTANLPPHSHVLSVDGDTDATKNVNTPADNLVLGRSAAAGESSAVINLYSSTGDKLVASALGGVAGGGQAHENRQPFLAVNFCICLTGIFPSRN